MNDNIMYDKLKSDSPDKRIFCYTSAFPKIVNSYLISDRPFLLFFKKTSPFGEFLVKLKIIHKNLDCHHFKDYDSYKKYKDSLLKK